jgi:hypothetical protein
MKTHIKNLLPLLLLLGLPGLVQAQDAYSTNADGSIYTYSTNADGSANIVAFAGPFPQVLTIPTNINGLTVTTIGDLAFDSDSALTSVTIPGSVTSIGVGVFEYCSRLTSVTIANSVTNIGGEAFFDCESLTSITVDTANPAYSSMNGVLFDKAQATLLQFPAGLGGSYTISNSVTSIGDFAFEFSSLTSVTIPNSVTSIGGNYAFANCTSLTSVTIPNSVTSIGFSAFNACRILSSVTIPNSVTNIGEEAFQDTGLTSITLPGSVTSIGPETFFGCTSLASVTIPNSVTSIGYEAFYGCESLTSVIIPNSVTIIGGYAFYFCTRLTSVTIPNSITGIGSFAFRQCTNLTSAYFLGNAPPNDNSVFFNDPVFVYYLAGTTGWGSTFGGRPALLWNPQANTFGFTGGQFGFNITSPSPTYAVIVVEACTNLSHPVWLPVSTNTLINLGPSAFSDPQSGSYPNRFYRFRSP